MNYLTQLDYSSLSEYLSCPRKFLFKYVLHLRSVKPNIDLIFGSCWHYGLECVYKELQVRQSSGGSESEQPPEKLMSVMEATKIASSSFTLLWSIEGEPHFPDSDIIFPKSPGHASNMYNEYFKQYLVYDLTDQKILSVESPFILRLSQMDQSLPNYTGRLDLVYQKKNGSLKIADHKTTKAVNATTYPSFQVSLQSDGYLCAGYTYFDSIPTLEYNVAMCQKSAIKFERYTVMKRKSAIDRFLEEVAFHAQAIISNLTIFHYEKQNTEKNFCPRCFPRSPGYACTAYFRTCSFFDLCNGRNNPLLWHNNPPQGYKIEEWNPEEHEANIKNKLEGAKK